MELKDLKVFIDAGHGGRDSGAVSLDERTKEKDITLYVANKLKNILNSWGVTTVMTRTTDVYVDYRTISNICNNSSSEIFVSIHCNAGGGTGTETYVVRGGSGYEKDLAKKVNDQLVRSFASRNRGVKENNYSVLTNNNAWAILTELLFMDNSIDIAKLRDSSKLDRAAQAIANGLNAFVYENFRDIEKQ